MLNVAAAMIKSGNKVLICRRPPNKARGLMWEFPGGKTEPGETPAQTVIRECREELGITLEVYEKIAETVHEYSDVAICLSLYEARILSGIPQPLEHTEICWATAADLSDYSFSAADTAFLPYVTERLDSSQESLKQIP